MTVQISLSTFKGTFLFEKYSILNKRCFFHGLETNTYISKISNANLIFYTASGSEWNQFFLYSTAIKQI